MTDASSQKRQPLLVGFVVFLFFAWGFATVLNDTLFPKLKGLYSLSYTEVMLTQFSFFLSYLVFSVPAGLLLSRIGYIRGVVVGLIGMALGCALFWPASESDTFIAFLLPLFVLAAGITMLQVAANPFMELLGSEATSHSRLTLAQAFNSLATMIGPIIGARLFLRGSLKVDPCAPLNFASTQLRQGQTHAIAVFYLIGAVVLLAVAVVFWNLRKSTAPAVSGQASFGGVLALLDRPRLMFGAACIFIYVGAEVSIGSVMTNYLAQPNVLHATCSAAGTLVSFYWGGAMVGRFIGSFALRFIRAGHALAACAVGATLLASLSATSTGTFAAYSLIAVGLCNSIMFPTIFSIATEQLGDETPHASGLLCMAIVGGAIIPLIVANIADATTLAMALFVPALCYIGIAIYGVAAARGLGLRKLAAG
jgi:FHS family L-fucose permease-like MFS transporter